MQPPRWFYATLAACAVILTLTSCYVMISRRNIGRWAPIAGASTESDIRALDTATGTLCLMIGTAKACADLPHGVVRHLEKSSSEHQ